MLDKLPSNGTEEVEVLDRITPDQLEESVQVVFAEMERRGLNLSKLDDRALDFAKELYAERGPRAVSALIKELDSRIEQMQIEVARKDIDQVFKRMDKEGLMDSTDRDQLRQAVEFVAQEIDKRNLTPDEWGQAAFALAKEYWGDRGRNHVGQLIGRLGMVWTKRQTAENNRMADNTRKTLNEVAERSRRLDEIVFGDANESRSRLEQLRQATER